jgi:hypothetical protein
LIATLGHQPATADHDPRNDVLTSAKRADKLKHDKYDAICAATGLTSLLSHSRRWGGCGASTAAKYELLTKHMPIRACRRTYGAPSQLRRLNKDKLAQRCAGARSLK